MVSASQVPVPPDLVMPHTAQTVATLGTGMVAVIAVGLAVALGLRHRTPLYLLVLFGGVLACINEPALDVVGGCLHPQTGGWTVFTAYDRPIPLWAVIAYGLYFGAVPLLVLALLRSAANPRTRLLQCVGVMFTANLLIEIPILSGDVYVYYGEQPFKIFGLFPIHWLFINGVGAALIAVVLYLYSDRFTGGKQLYWLAIPPTAQFVALSISIPAFTLFNTDVSTPVKWVGSAVTMLLGAAALRALAQLVPQRAAAAGEAEIIDQPLVGSVRA
jgi:hypothetical protein